VAKVEIPEIAEVLTSIESMRLEFAEIKAIVRPAHVWWTKRQMCAAKRGLEKRIRGKELAEFESFYNSIRGKPAYWPPEEPKDVGGTICYHESVVRVWLQMSDAEVAEYRKKYLKEHAA